jgi:hypothetical protein
MGPGPRPPGLGFPLTRPSLRPCLGGRVHNVPGGIRSETLPRSTRMTGDLSGSRPSGSLVRAWRQDTIAEKRPTRVVERTSSGESRLRPGDQTAGHAVQGASRVKLDALACVAQERERS